MFDLGDMSLIVFISTCSVKTCLERSTESSLRKTVSFQFDTIVEFAKNSFSENVFVWSISNRRSISSSVPH